MSAAAARAFEINEVVEFILEHLPMKDLLAVQVVCRRWKHVTSACPTLRQHLFLEPIAPGHQLPASLFEGADEDHSDPTWSVGNPLLAATFPVWFKFTESEATDNSDSENSRVREHGELCLQQEPITRILAGSAGIDVKHPRFAALYRRDASWRRMLAFQPPHARKSLTRWEQGVFSPTWSLPLPSTNGEQPERIMMLEQHYELSGRWQKLCRFEDIILVVDGIRGADIAGMVLWLCRKKTCGGGDGGVEGDKEQGQEQLVLNFGVVKKEDRKRRR